jgi:hypothetical protein
MMPHTDLCTSASVLWRVRCLGCGLRGVEFGGWGLEVGVVGCELGVGG